MLSFDKKKTNLKLNTEFMLQIPLLPPAKEVCKGYVFTGVCLSTGGGVCSIACWDTHPLAGTPPCRYTPCRYTPSRYTPRRSACWDTVNKRAVRIPLECILGHWNVFLVESDVFASILRVDSGFRQSCHIYLKETCFMVLTSHWLKLIQRYNGLSPELPLEFFAAFSEMDQHHSSFSQFPQKWQIWHFCRCCSYSPPRKYYVIIKY